MSASEDTCGDLKTHVLSEWKIEKTDVMSKQAGEFLTSPVFHALGGNWQITLFPRGMNEDSKGYVSLVLKLLCCSKPFHAHISYKLLFDNGDDNIHNIPSVVNINRLPYATNDTLKMERLCKYEKLVSDYLCLPKTKTFTLRYRFVADGPPTNIPEPLTFDKDLNNQQYSDVKFSVNGNELYAHKILLANRSKVFAAMFEHEMKENMDNMVNIEDVEYNVLLELFRYIYSGAVNDIKRIAKPLLIAADKYDIIDLKTYCGDYLGATITINNVQECLVLAERYNVSSLTRKAVEFIKSNAKEIVQTPVFKSIMESHPDVVLEVVRYLSEK